MNSRRPPRLGSTLLLLVCLSPPTPAGAQEIPDGLLDVLEWRELGPAVFGGRITDIALLEGEPGFLLVAGASGGLFRSRNSGTTWECIFQHEGTISIGDIALDQADSDVIWVGSGEGNNQRSSYWGDGVYKTTDGGETWSNTGLADSHHIGRVVIDPTDRDTVWVAALGHLYTPNEERGLYKTSDGGATWKRKLHVDADVGVVDVVLDPSDPDTVYAATYERRRRAWHFDGAGPGSAIHKSVDGGEHWRRLTGGLPEGEIGRIGLALYPPDPDVLYATVSNQNRVEVAPDEDPTLSFRTRFREGEMRVRSVAQGGGAERVGLRRGDVLLSLGEVQLDSSWSWFGALAKYGRDEEIELVFRRDEEEQRARVTLDELLSTEQVPPRTRAVGGEIYRTADGGESWTRVNEDPVGGSPAYYYGQIRVDPRDDQRLYLLGVPLYTSSDGGKSWQTIASSVHVDHHAFEIDPGNSRRLVLGNDGGLAMSHDGGETWDHYSNLPLAQFYAVGVDMSVPFRVYGGTQDNGTWGGPSRSRGGRGIAGAEWYRVGGGDGFYAQVDPADPNTVYGESQFGAVYRRDLASGASRGIRPPRAPEGEAANRFNWNSPILVSHHNPQVIYFGGNRFYKSYDRGDHWQVVSRDLTTADPEKIAGNVPHCTLTTIAESPLDPNLLLVGADDGMLHRSEDGGLSWTNLTGRFPAVPSNWWVSRVELSRHSADVGYVSFTGYREDDFRAFVYRTENRGQNWALIAGDLPDEPVNVVREDPRNPDVLYVGTEFGAYVSIDRGEHWTGLGTGLPTIAVHDLVVHARDAELVLATHGRGFWALDVSAVQELSADTLAKEAHLFAVGDAVTWRSGGGGGWSGERVFFGQNPPRGATITYYLSREFAKDEIELSIEDASGAVVATPDVERDAGLHTASWNLRPRVQGGGQGGARGQGRRRFGGGAPARHGRYTAVLRVGGEELRQVFEVVQDPLLE